MVYRWLETTAEEFGPRYEQVKETQLLLVAFGVFVGSVVLELLGLNLGLLRPVIVVPFLSLVPGFLVVRLLRLDGRDFTTVLLYSLGLSLVVLMLAGWVANTILPLVGIERVFGEVQLFVIVLATTGGLFGFYSARGHSRPVDLDRYVATVWRPSTLGLLCVPLLAILGARLVTRFGNNVLILAVLALLGVLATAVYAGYLSEALLPLVVWVISVSLLLHNATLTHVIAWDAYAFELPLAQHVVENGVWAPDESPVGRWMKNSMLRIVLLHPIYSQLTGISLLWEFKTVSPILFSVAPVAFYKSYHVLVDKREAVISILLAVSLFSFFTVLAWNSRTSGALLFLSLVALSVTDTTLDRRSQRVLMGAFLFGLLVSHYGVSFMLLAAMPLIIVGNWVLLGRERAQTVAKTTIVVVALFAVVTMAWYTFVMYDAAGLSRLSSFVSGLLTDIWLEFFGPSEYQLVSAEKSVSTKYATTRYTSNTISWLQPLNILVGLLASAGIGIQFLRQVEWRVPFEVGPFGRRDGAPQTPTEVARVEYLLYATAFLGVFGITFLPVAKLNTARTLMPALLFFAPFVVLFVTFLISRAAVLVDATTVRRVGKVAAATIILVYFALNVGLYGTMENEYHPNILIDKGDVLTDGNLAEKTYFWAMYGESIHDLQAKDWLDGHVGSREGIQLLNSKRVVSGMYACTNVSREPIVRQGTCQDSPAFAESQRNKIYATEGSIVYQNSAVTQGSTEQS